MLSSPLNKTAHHLPLPHDMHPDLRVHTDKTLTMSDQRKPNVIVSATSETSKTALRGFDNVLHAIRACIFSTTLPVTIRRDVLSNVIPTVSLLQTFRRCVRHWLYRGPLLSLLAGSRVILRKASFMLMIGAICLSDAGGGRGLR